MYKSKFAKWIMLPVFLSCAGCSTSRDISSEVASYKAASSCCNSLMSVKFYNVKLGVTHLSIDATDKAFLFPAAGKSYFKAFIIPASDRPLTADVRSSVFIDNQGKRLALFFPQITLLDANMNFVASVSSGPEGTLFPTDLRSASYVHAAISLADHPSARYLFIHTQASQIDLVREMGTTPPPLGGGAVPYLVGTMFGDHVTVVGSPVSPGLLQLEVNSPD